MKVPTYSWFPNHWNEGHQFSKWRRESRTFYYTTWHCYDLIVLQAYLQTTQNSLSHSQRDEYTIFSDIFLLAILRTRAANSRAQVFLMAHMSTDIKPFQIPVLKSLVFPDMLLLIWQLSIWGSGISVCWKHSLLLAGHSLQNTFTF